MRHVTKVLKDMPTVYLERGKQWYNDAHNFAAYLSETYKVSFDRVCAVISAMSPACKWETNKQDAERLITCYVCDGDYTRLSFSTYGMNVVKAWSILTDMDKETDSFFNAKTGAKTLSFYRNILNPQDDNYVTIDRHMMAIFEGRVGKSSGSARVTPKQYRMVSADFGKLAKKHGLTPCQLQAALWEYHLDLIGQN